MNLNKNLLALLDKVHEFKMATGENHIQNQIVLVLKTLSLTNELKCIWFHVPNEGRISNKIEIRQASKKHFLGMINGSPDLVLLSKEKAVCLEVKTQKGHLTDEQKLFKSWSEDLDVPYYIVRSVEDVYAVLKRENLYASKEK